MIVFWRAAIVVFITILPKMAISAEVVEDQLKQQCFDVALVAKILRQDSVKFEYNPEKEILIASPFDLDIRVETVLLGVEHRREFKVRKVMHQKYNNPIGDFLFFLKHRDDGVLFVTDDMWDVVRDNKGRYVVPVEAPFDAEALKVHYWIPADYQQWLKPIDYRIKKAWWLAEKEFRSDNDGIEEEMADWRFVRNGWVVAKRGLILEDLPKILEKENPMRCQR